MIRRGIATGWAMLAILIIVMPISDVDATDSGVSLLNYSESRGCEPYDRGFARPYVTRTGPLTASDQIRGPWGDMFGRSYYQVRDSLVNWQLPGSNKVLRVHQRMLPALEQAGANLNQHLAQGKSYYVYSGVAWVWRTVGGTLQPSEHAIGTAFDINPQSNPYSRDNYLRTDIPAWFVDSFVDAGFCWGGNWVDVKDAMHFSWSGPIATENYGPRPVPYPPVTSSANYAGTVVEHTSRLTSVADASIVVGDITGEGAPDIIKVAASGRLEATGAIGDYSQIAERGTVPSSDWPTLIGDLDLDGKPDAWVPWNNGGALSIDVYSHASDYEGVTSLTTIIPSDTDTLMLGYYDDDFIPDIYALVGGAFRVYGSKSNFQTTTATIAMPSGADASWHFATGDHDFDGRADVYAVANGAAPALRGTTASGSGFSATIGRPVDPASTVDLGDYDGDGREDVFILSGGTLRIVLGGNSSGAPDAWFQRTSSIVPDAGPECTGEHCDTIGYVDEGGIWAIAEEPSTSTDTLEFYYGNPADVPFMGDWDCDGIDTPGLYRQSDGFVYLRNSNTQGVADLQFYFGNPSDVPLIGDFNGDGCDTVSLFRPSQQRMYVINALGKDGAGLGEADFYFQFGNGTDRPFTGDFDGDGMDEIGLFRPSNTTIYLKWELAGGAADHSFVYGSSDDIPIAGDWNGDGTDTVALYRDSNGIWYVRLSHAGGSADHAIHFHDHGGATLPVAGFAG